MLSFLMRLAAPKQVKAFAAAAVSKGKADASLPQRTGSPVSRAGLMGGAIALVLALAAGLLLAPMALANPAGTGPSTVLVVGDSLSAEYGLARGEGWVALLETRLAGSPWRVVNASISGDTTSGGKTRLASLLAQHKPKLVVLELGGNDALRGLPLSMTEGNLAAMAQQANAAGARVLLLGMAVPPNYGRKYGEDFQALYGRVAKAQGATLVPFFLAGVADVPDAEQWFQADRIHPNAKAHPKMLANVWPALEPMLGTGKTRRSP